jgi:hypothetical protein
MFFEANKQKDKQKRATCVNQPKFRGLFQVFPCKIQILLTALSSVIAAAKPIISLSRCQNKPNKQQRAKNQQRNKQIRTCKGFVRGFRSFFNIVLHSTRRARPAGRRAGRGESARRRPGSRRARPAPARCRRAPPDADAAAQTART